MNILEHLTPDVLERFWSKVEKTDSCWNWTAGKVHDGYGRFKLAGKVRKANRISWMIANNRKNS